ncbi:MAG: hypothetical protein AAB883_03340, partial [Patescibacteria group bacterium]
MSAFAATAKPSCALTVTTSAGTVDTTKKVSVLVTEGDTLRLVWEGKNVKKVIEIYTEYPYLDSINK